MVFSYILDGQQHYLFIMGRFGFGKKGEGEEDSNRLALFGSRSKSKSPAPPTNNPYATPAAPPDPYTQAKMNAGILPPQQSQQAPPGYPNNRGPPQPFGADKKNAGSQNGYSANRYGNEGGYGAGGGGSNPYASHTQTSGTARSGGYGGLGPSKHVDDEPDNNRDALFGAAPQRVQQHQQNGPPDYDYNPAMDPSESRSYGAYGDRQLTAEEEEEEDINALKQDIKQKKEETVSSTRRALQMAEQAEETGRNTLARLGAQGERLHNTKKNLDLAQNQVSAAEDKTEELRRLNRNFMIPAHNPFTNKSRIEKEEMKIRNNHAAEREQREATRNQAFRANQRMNQNYKTLNDASRNTGTGRTPNLAERGKYQFEADSDDDRVEDEIDQNIELLSGAASRMNMISKALGEEIESQNKVIEGIGEQVRILKSIVFDRVLMIVQSDAVDDRVVLQTARLRRIR